MTSTQTLKRCTGCGEEKALDAYYHSTDGIYARCKICHRGSVRRYQRQLSPRERRIQQTIAAYLIDRDHAARLVDARVCEICGVESDSLEIDHCHATGRVRGALCGRCNKGIAFFDHDPAWLINATAYVWPLPEVCQAEVTERWLWAGDDTAVSHDERPS